MACKSGDADAHDQHARGRDGSGGGGEHGKDARQGVGGEDHRLVAADGAHRGERVHALGAGGAGHQLDGERGCSGGGNVLNRVDVAQRTQEADQHLAAPQQRQILLAGAVVGAVRQHLQNNVGLGEHLCAINCKRCPLGRVFGIGIAGFDTSPGFEDYVQSSFFKIGNDCGYKRDPPLPRKDLAGNTDQHEGASTDSAKWRTLHSNRAGRELYWKGKETAQDESKMKTRSRWGSGCFAIVGSG